jgi:hypothetical protein
MAIVRRVRGPSYRSIIEPKYRLLCKVIVRAVWDPSYRSIIMAK